MTPQQSTFAAIYAEYAPHVGRVARYFGVPREQLPDVTQEVWLSVLPRLGGLDLSRPLRPWLTAVVWNHVRHLRRSYARQLRKKEALAVVGEVHGEAGEAPMTRSEAAWTLSSVLTALPEEQREVLMLCDGEGMSAPEVSEALGVQLNTVYSRLRLARRRCQTLAATLGASGLAALLERHVAELTPPADELARVAAAVEHAAAAPVAPLASPAASKSSLLPWLGVSAIAAVVAGAAALSSLRGEPPQTVERVEPPRLATNDAPRVEPPPPIVATMPTVVPPTPPRLAEAPRPTPAKRRRAAAGAPTTPTSPPLPSTSAPRTADRASLAAEHRILADAKAALAAGKAQQALALLDEHRRDFPGSASADIRDLLRVQIHCERGNVDRARTIAADYPRDPQFAALLAKRCK